MFKFSKVESTHNRITKDYEGSFPWTPVVGQSFYFIYWSDEAQDYRQVITSPVQEYNIADNGFIIKTKNSTYKVEEIAP
jgi:hypothetical protein